MALTKHCDRCGKLLPHGREDILDFLKREYPSLDICPSCDLEIVLAASAAQGDALRKLPPGTTIRRMLANYE